MRKIAVTLLALMLALSMAAPAFAASQKITKQTAEIAEVDAGERGPGYEIRLPLVKEAFSEATADLTMSDVRTSNIAAKHTVKTGSKAIDSVEIKANSSGVACIVVKLIDPFVSTKPLDFETNVYLTIGGKRQSFNIGVYGTLTNGESNINADTDYVDLSGGQTAVCDETTSGKVEAYLGDNVTVFVRMLKGKSYYGSVARGPEESDDAVMNRYPDIDDVFTLAVLGLDGSGSTVKLDVEEGLFVYSKDFEYLGKSSDSLPFSAKYYLATKKLNISEPEDEEIDDEDIYEPEDGEEIEPDGEVNGLEGVPDNVLGAVAPSGGNTSGNPDTGVSPLLGASIAAGIISLTVMAAISGKRTNKK